jgi:diadenosine tetraphosphatase ApaH/serine/threonine PP2A family protein phosphatase
MKLALLADVHANLRAWRACLAHAQAQGASRFAVLGDSVGYGAEPAAVLDDIMLLAEAGALVVRGNHDQLAAAPPAAAATSGESGAAWTAAQLSAAQRAFLANLPLEARLDDVLLVHASADAPRLWRYVHDARLAALSLDAARAAGARYVFGGHVHRHTLWYRGTGRSLMPFTPTCGVPVPVPRHREWLATIGSVGQPRDGHTDALYAIFDSPAARLTFHRVPYDHAGAAAAVRAAGLPESYAERLEQGC